MVTHPFDSSRLLTPMVTGVLPASKPMISRGQVYCGHDFRQRAVAWFVSEQAASTKARTLLATKTATRAKKAVHTTAPSRVQPARAAKRKACAISEQQTAPPKKRLRIVLTKASSVKTPEPSSSTCSYTVSPVYATATPAQFKAGLDMVLDAKRASLASGCHWSTSLFPSPAVFPTTSPRLCHDSLDTPPYTAISSWCPDAAEPLACIDQAYCLHSIGRLTPPPSKSIPTPTPTPTPKWAPEAAMSPPCTPPPEIVLKPRAKGFAEMRHVQERTVEFGGLRFAVDVCDGSMRVWVL